MRSSKKLWLVTLLILAFVAVFALSVLGGCKRNKTPGGYYLSVFENGEWTSYTSDDDVPEANKFTQDEANESLYRLTVVLEQGALVKIARVNSTETHGYSELFSTLTALAEGADDAISVAAAGTFAFALNVADSEITYQFTAKTQPEPDCKCEQCADDCECKNCDGTACQCHGSDAPTVLSVEISGVTGSSFTLTYPETKSLTATVYYDDGTTSTSVTWESSAASVASVTNGLVASVSAGTAQITAKSGGVSSDPISVTVNGVVTLDQTEVTLNVGATATLTATALGGATIENWRSSDEGVATVDEHGVITAQAAGTATITVDYYQRPGSLTTVTCSVKVNKAVTGISLSTSALTVENGEEETLTVTIAPADATNQNYSFSLSDGGDAIIGVTQDGKTLIIEGKSVGSATITVKSEDGNHTAECVVTVVEAGQTIVSITSGGTVVQGVSLHKTTSNTAELTVSVTNGTIQSVAWQSSATAVATVTASGESTTVTSVGFGTATVTATVRLVGEDSDRTLTCTVLVAPENLFLYGDYGDAAWSTSVADLGTAGMVFTETSDPGIYTLTFDLLSGKLFRIGHDDGFTDDWAGFGYSHRNTSSFENMGAGTTDNNISPTVTGNYTITVDLTGTSVKVSIVCNSIAVTGIALTTSGDTTLQPGNNESVTINLTITPSNADYNASDIVWTCSDTESVRVTMVIADGRLSVTVTVKATATAGTVTITCTLAGQTSTQELTVLAAGSQKTEVSSITFEESSYSLDVVAGSWTTTVKAKVNEDASVQTVTYSASEDGVSVDDSGNVTATKLGTYTITAIATDKTSVTTTTTVTFYSSQLYLIGISGWTAVTGSSTEGTDFENYTLSATDGTNQVFAVTVALGANDKFSVAFIGMATDWSNKISSANLVSNGDAANADSDKNIKGSQGAGLYIVTVDLSEAVEKVTVEYLGVSATLSGGETNVKSMATLSSDGKYEISITATLTTDVEYTIVIASVKATITTITTVTSEYFQNATGAFKCVSAGEYIFDILCDTDGSCTVTVTKLDTDNETWDAYTGYYIAVWSNKSDGTLGTVTSYYNATRNQYKLCFSYTAGTAWDNFNFCIYTDSAHTEWVADIQPNTVSSAATYNNSASLQGDSNKFYTSATGTFYFEVIFTVSGSSITYVSVQTGTTDFDA